MVSGLYRHLLFAALAMVAGAGVTTNAAAAPATGLLRHGIVPGEFVQAEAIAVEIEPMPLLKASKELAKIFGAPVKVVKTLEPSTLAVYAPSTTPDELRAKIAATFNATWTLREGIWYLDQTAQQIRAEAAVELERRKTAIRSMLEKAQKAKGSQKPFTDTEARSLYNQLKDLTKNGIKRDDDATYRRLDQLQNRGPERRLMERMLSKLTDEMFLAVPAGERRVFALKPTAMQLPLNLDFKEDIDRFIEEQGTWSLATGGQPVTSDTGSAWSRLSENVKPIEQPIDNILISIQASHGSSFNVECKLVDPKGFYLSEGILGTYSSEDNEGFDLNSLYGMGAKAQERAKELSTDSLNFRRLLWGVDPVTWKPMEPDADFFNKAARLSVKDPLAYSTWEYLKKEAKDLNVSFAASLPDSSLLIAYGLLNLFRDPKTATLPRKYFGMDIRDEGSWMLITPTNVVRQRIDYRDRTNLESLIRLREIPKNRSLEADAAYVLSLPDEASYSILDEIIRRFSDREESISNDRYSLCLYGLVPASIRTDSVAKKGVLLNQLSKDVQQLIYKWVYFGSNYRLQYEPQDGNFNEVKSNLFWEGVLSEPTVSMPNGIPSKTTVQFDTKEEVVVKTTSSQQSMARGEFITAEELAQRVFQQSRPDLYPWVAEGGQYTVNTNQLKLYRKRETKFLIDFKNDFVLRGSLTEAEASDSGILTLQTLPAEFKKKYQETYKRLQDQAKNRKPSPGNGPKKDIPPTP